MLLPAPLLVLLLLLLLLPDEALFGLGEVAKLGSNSLKKDRACGRSMQCVVSPVYSPPLTTIDEPLLIAEQSVHCLVRSRHAICRLLITSGNILTMCGITVIRELVSLNWV